MSLLSYDEELYMRVLNGRVVGKYILKELNRVGFLVIDNKMCTAFAASAEASFIEETNGVVKNYVLGKESEKDLVERISKDNLQALIIIFGGESDNETLKDSLKNILGIIAEMTLEIDLIIHMKEFAIGGIDYALKDKKISSYLSIMDNVYVYNPDFDNGYMVFYSAYVEGEKFHIEEIERYSLTYEHAVLLNKSLKDRTPEWK